MVKCFISHDSDPCSPYYTAFDFQIGDCWVTSIYMAFWVIIFRVHHRLDLARQLTENSTLRRSATRISRWVKVQRFTVMPHWSFQLEEIYGKVLSHLVTVVNSTLIRRFLALRQENLHDVEFVLTTQQRNDYVWSCGLSPSSNRLEQHQEYGFNLYGMVMTRIYKEWLGESLLVNPPLMTSLTAMETCAVSNHRYTVLVIADSQCKQLQSIQNGKVISIGGAKYDTLADSVRRFGIRPIHYKYIIISCGVNSCRRYDRRSWRRSWERLALALRNVINSDSHFLILNLPVWTTRSRYIAEHTEFMRSLTGSINNLAIADWSQPVDNPFIIEGPRIDSSLFGSDRFHINHRGFRLLWLAWCQIYSELIPISYKLSVTPYQQT